MALKTTGDECMFCQTSPCTCNTRPKAKPKAKPITTIKPPPILSPSTKPDPPIKPVPTLKPVPPIPKSTTTPSVIPKAVNKLSATVKETTDSERSMSDALICVISVFHLPRDEIMKHRTHLDLTDTQVEALVWRSENAIENRNRNRKRG